jgi:hypothetical protein
VVFVLRFILAVRQTQLRRNIHIKSACEEFRAACYTNTNAEFALERTLEKSWKIITEFVRDAALLSTFSDVRVYCSLSSSTQKNQQQPEGQNFSSYLTENIEHVRCKRKLFFVIKILRNI